MKKHIVFFISLLAIIFTLEGISFLFSAKDSGSLFSVFIAFIHLFIVFGLIKRKKWVPHLGIFFEAYLVINFFIGNMRTLLSPEIFPSAISVLSVSAFIGVSLFVLREQFTE